jgi:prevent-host-death family protein
LTTEEKTRNLRILETAMERFSALDLQQRTGEVQSAALREPVAVTFHGRPRAVMMSVEEFTRLKHAAGEPPPHDLYVRRAVTQRGLPDDPLGYDTADFRACAATMAEAALSGRNKSAIRAEIDAIEKRLGLRK